MKYVLLHAHGYAGAKGKRSYLKMGVYSSPQTARSAGAKKGLDGFRVVPLSKLRKSSLHKLLFYIA